MLICIISVTKISLKHSVYVIFLWKKTVQQRGQVQTRALVICFNLFLVKFPILDYIWPSWLSLLSIVDWMSWGWSCLSHLCNILIGQSDIVKVVVFFEPSQFTNHIATHTEQVLLVSKTDLDFVGILKPCWYFQGWSIF